MSVEISSFNILTEQTSKYLTPFELEVFGNTHLEGDQAAAEIVSEDPSNPQLIFEANQFRREHPVFFGMPFVFEPECVVPLLRQGFKTQFEVAPLDETGHSDTIILHIMKDNLLVEDLSSINLKLREDKRDHILLEKLPAGIVLHPKSPAE